MFRQKYREANAAIHAPKEVLERLGVKPMRSRKLVMQYAVACLAVCLVATGTFVLLGTGGAINTQEGKVTAKTVQSYDELYDLVASAQSGGTYGRNRVGDLAIGEGKSITPAVPAPATQGSSSDASKGLATQSKDYSNTNVQVKGVDEADVVKTDGSYIYRLSDNVVTIIRADGAKMTVVSRIQVSKSGQGPVASEMYVLGDRLLVISQEYQIYYMYDAKPGTAATGAEISKGKFVPPTNPVEPKTYATVYDIADRSNPKKVNQLSQSGSYLSSRMVGDVVYLLSNYYVYSMVKGQPETYAPKVGSGSDTRLVAPGNIQTFENPDTASYVVVTSIGIKNATQHGSVKAVLGCAGTVYASTSSLLVAAAQYTEDKTPVHKDANGKNVVTVTYSQVTKLLLFAIDKGIITEKASATVPGLLHNQFSMDEYNGTFRICTTNTVNTTTVSTDGIDAYEYSNSMSNALYTLDANLKTLGSVKDLAKGETIYSVRFDGPVGYLVTFRRVDPLFAVDLSDPSNPKVLSQLKIPGFSEYLHVYGNGLLFGFGKDADADTGKVKGLKLSMFDTSDLKDVKLLKSKAIDAFWSDASYNHKAILIDAQRSLIAFPAEDKYYVYGFDSTTGFFQKAKLDMGQDMWDQTMRGLFIENVFYVCGTNQITAYSLANFAKLGSLKLK